MTRGLVAIPGGPDIFIDVSRIAAALQVAKKRVPRIEMERTRVSLKTEKFIFQSW